MIRYALACDAGHAFESWFPSSAAYDEQAERGLVSCPVCGSSRIAKQLMRPSIARTDRAEAATALQSDTLPAPMPSTPVQPPVPNPPVALFSEQERALRQMLREVREQVVRNAEHVGDRFVDEARRMHYGETEHRSIYGEAKPEEARELVEEGVAIMPLPVIADDRN
jgi:hypothetical protein